MLSPHTEHRWTRQHGDLRYDPQPTLGVLLWPRAPQGREQLASACPQEGCFWEGASQVPLQGRAHTSPADQQVATVPGTGRPSAQPASKAHTCARVCGKDGVCVFTCSQNSSAPVDII